MDLANSLQEVLGEHVSPQALAAAAAILGQRPALGLVHMTARIEPGPTGPTFVWRITGWNRTFLAIADVPAPLKTSHLEGVFVKNPVFLNADSRSLSTASIARIHSIIDSFLRHETAYGSLQYVHISKAGRCKKVYKEMIAINVSATHAEFLGIETLLAENFPLAADLNPISVGVTLRPSFSYPPQAPAPRPAVVAQSAFMREEIMPCWRWTVVDKSEAQHRGQRRNAKKRQQVTCAHCGDAETSTQRSGPEGTTLCNRCGLRWRKDEAHSGALSNTPAPGTV